MLKSGRQTQVPVCCMVLPSRFLITGMLRDIVELQNVHAGEYWHSNLQPCAYFCLFVHIPGRQTHV